MAVVGRSRNCGPQQAGDESHNRQAGHGGRCPGTAVLLKFRVASEHELHPTQPFSLFSLARDILLAQTNVSVNLYR